MEAIGLDPDLFDAHNGLGVALATGGKPEEAAAQFRELIRIDPDSPIGYYNLGNVLADLDRDTESAAALREVIRINPNHYNARYNLGEMFRLEQKYDDSATQFREYLRLAPEVPRNQQNIARAKRLVRQFEDPNAPVEPAPRMPRWTCCGDIKPPGQLWPQLQDCGPAGQRARLTGAPRIRRSTAPGSTWRRAAASRSTRVVSERL